MEAAGRSWVLVGKKVRLPHCQWVERKGRCYLGFLSNGRWLQTWQERWWIGGSLGCPGAAGHVHLEHSAIQTRDANLTVWESGRMRLDSPGGCICSLYRNHRAARG